MDSEDPMTPEPAHRVVSVQVRSHAPLVLAEHRSTPLTSTVKLIGVFHDRAR